MIHQRHRQTDRQTDDMRSQDRALHYSASRGNRTASSVAYFRSSVVVVYLQIEKRVAGHWSLIRVHSTAGHLLVTSLSACVVSILDTTHAPVHLEYILKTSRAQVRPVLVLCLTELSRTHTKIPRALLQV